MKTTLEKEDIEAIATEVLNMVKPLLVSNGGDEDTIFDVKGLAEHLKVEESWVYKQVSLGTLPYFKAGKYIRFSKSAIEKWIEKNAVKPVSPLKIVKNRG